MKNILYQSSIVEFKLFLRIMKLSVLALFLFVGTMFATETYSQSRKVTIVANNISINKVLLSIEKQTDYLFVFNAKNVNLNKSVNVNMHNRSVAEVLDMILRDTDINYAMDGKNIMLRKNSIIQVRRNTPADDKKKITGVVKDLSGMPIIGANISVTGNSTKAITDINGKFEMDLSSDGVLQVSYVGYEERFINTKDKQNFVIIMKENTQQLNEVVVVGYGTQKKATLTGSVSSVSSKELMEAPMQNVSNLLTGKVTGLTSIQSSGKPGGDGTALYVRGLNTFGNGGNSPMIIIDGVQRLLDYINPNDIESISVLKDASAAIYGVQGANGVILITTKSGVNGPAKIAYDGSVTLTANTAMPKYLNAGDYMYWNNKARQMDGLTPLWTADIQNKVMNNDPNSIWGQTNWIDKIFHTGETQQHNVSASGGNDKNKYFASLGYMDQKGTLKNTLFKRYNVRTNLDIQVVKNLKFTTNLSAYRTDRDYPGTAIGDQAEFDPVRQAVNSIPIIKDEYKGLPTAWQGATYYVNGYAALMNSGYQRQTRWAFDSNYKLEYDFSDLTNILKGLKVSFFGAYNYSHTTDSNYDRYYQLYSINNTFDENIVGASGYTEGGAYTKSSSWGDTWLVRPQVDYSRDFNKHHISALFFYEAQKTYSNTMTGIKRGYYSDDPVDLSLGTTFPANPVSGSYAYSGQASWAGRINYAYDMKYLAEASFRRDGTYIFAPENRWGFFPSVSLGWVASEENFFKKILPFVDYFKIRASYGESGNCDAIPYLYNSTFGIANNSMVFGGAPLSQFYTTNDYIYRNLTWSKTKSYNLGFEFDLWNHLLSGEIDVFYQLNKNILEGSSGNYPPSLGGYYPSQSNTGEVDNRGLEITLKHYNRINKDWTYNISGSFSYARNRVLKMAVTDNYPNYRGILGKSMNARYGFQAVGLFQTQQEIDNYTTAPSGTIRLGDIKYRDVNGDGLITSTYDYVKIGYGPIPEINFSMNFELTYKNFNFSMLWQGVTHCDYELSGVYNTGVTSCTTYTSPFTGGGNSPYYLIEGAWTPENTNAKYPRLSTIDNGNNAWRSSWWVVNGEYLRLKNLKIGYTMPDRMLKRTPFSRINIYLAGTNLLTLSHFKYVDPESPSVSNGYYPQQLTYSLGVNVTF